MLKTAYFLGVCLLISIGGALTACGTKGPLYIPEQRYPQKPVPQDEGKMGAPEANTGAPSSPAP